MASLETLEKPAPAPVAEETPANMSYEHPNFWDPNGNHEKMRLWREEMTARAEQRIQDFLAQPEARRVRLLSTKSTLHDGILGASINVIDDLRAKLTNNYDGGEFIVREPDLNPNLFVRAIDLGNGVYLRTATYDFISHRSRLWGDDKEYDMFAELVRADSIDGLKQIDKNHFFGDEPLDQPPITPDKPFTNKEALKRGWEVLNSLNTLYSIDDPELGKISFFGSVLRCLGHCAAGTAEDLPAEGVGIPPVNPWKLTKGLARASVSKEQRRKIIQAVGENMSFGDLLGMLGMMDVMMQAQKNGKNLAGAKDEAWHMYSDLLRSDVKRRGGVAVKNGGEQVKDIPSSRVS